ncbi:hypothetical protein D3C87_1037550 [compost metagenome]
MDIAAADVCRRQRHWRAQRSGRRGGGFRWGCADWPHVRRSRHCQGRRQRREMESPGLLLARRARCRRARYPARRGGPGPGRCPGGPGDRQRHPPSAGRRNQWPWHAGNWLRRRGRWRRHAGSGRRYPARHRELQRLPAEHLCADAGRGRRVLRHQRARHHRRHPLRVREGAEQRPGQAGQWHAAADRRQHLHRRDHGGCRHAGHRQHGGTGRGRRPAQQWRGTAVHGVRRGGLRATGDRRRTPVGGRRHGVRGVGPHRSARHTSHRFRRQHRHGQPLEFSWGDL